MEGDQHDVTSILSHIRFLCIAERMPPRDDPDAIAIHAPHEPNADPDGTLFFSHATRIRLSRAALALANAYSNVETQHRSEFKMSGKKGSRKVRSRFLPDSNATC